MTYAPETILAVNAGSSSLKMAFFQRDVKGTLSERLRITRDRHAGNAVRIFHSVEAVSAQENPAPAAAPKNAHTNARGDIHASLSAIPAGTSDSEFLATICRHLSPDAVVHRVVHGGDESRECVPLDAGERRRLHTLAPLAPLHQLPALQLIDALGDAAPALAQFACFDTAFHAHLPDVARDYALPMDIRKRHPQLRAYGFHGISCRSVVNALREKGELPRRLVIAHLGSGASVTAVHDGKSIATSMGFSALEGLVMATRPGRLDAGTLLYLLRHEATDADALENLLYRQSGLLGYSGISADMRVLLNSEDARAQAAVDLFVYRAAQEIAALCVALGGLDTLVFTGGIGENQPAIRERIAYRLRFVGDFGVRMVNCDEERAMASALEQPAAPATPH